MTSFINSTPTAITDAPVTAQDGNSPIVVSKKLATKNPKKRDVRLKSMLSLSKISWHFNSEDNDIEFRDPRINLLFYNFKYF